MKAAGKAFLVAAAATAGVLAVAAAVAAAVRPRGVW